VGNPKPDVGKKNGNEKKAQINAGKMNQKKNGQIAGGSKGHKQQHEDASGSSSAEMTAPFGSERSNSDSEPGHDDSPQRDRTSRSISSSEDGESGIDESSQASRDPDSDNTAGARQKVESEESSHGSLKKSADPDKKSADKEKGEESQAADDEETYNDSDSDSDSDSDNTKQRDGVSLLKKEIREMEQRLLRANARVKRFRDEKQARLARRQAAKGTSPPGSGPKSPRVTDKNVNLQRDKGRLDHHAQKGSTKSGQAESKTAKKLAGKRGKKEDEDSYSQDGQIEDESSDTDSRKISSKIKSGGMKERDRQHNRDGSESRIKESKRTSKKVLGTKKDRKSYSDDDSEGGDESSDADDEKMAKRKSGGKKRGRESYSDDDDNQSSHDSIAGDGKKKHTTSVNVKKRKVDTRARTDNGQTKSERSVRDVDNSSRKSKGKSKGRKPNRGSRSVSRHDDSSGYSDDVETERRSETSSSSSSTDSDSTQTRHMTDKSPTSKKMHDKKSKRKSGSSETDDARDESSEMVMSDTDEDKKKRSSRNTHTTKSAAAIHSDSETKMRNASMAGSTPDVDIDGAKANATIHARATAPVDAVAEFMARVAKMKGTLPKLPDAVIQTSSAAAAMQQEDSSSVPTFEEQMGVPNIEGDFPDAKVHRREAKIYDYHKGQDYNLVVTAGPYCKIYQDKPGCNVTGNHMHTVGESSAESSLSNVDESEPESKPGGQTTQTPRSAYDADNAWGAKASDPKPQLQQEVGVTAPKSAEFDHKAAIGTSSSQQIRPPSSQQNHDLGPATPQTKTQTQTQAQAQNGAGLNSVRTPVLNPLMSKKGAKLGALHVYKAVLAPSPKQPEDAVVSLDDGLDFGGAVAVAASQRGRVYVVGGPHAPSAPVKKWMINQGMDVVNGGEGQIEGPILLGRLEDDGTQTQNDENNDDNGNHAHGKYVDRGGERAGSLSALALRSTPSPMLFTMEDVVSVRSGMWKLTDCDMSGPKTVLSVVGGRAHAILDRCYIRKPPQSSLVTYACGVMVADEAHVELMRTSVNDANVGVQVCIYACSMCHTLCGSHCC
jgi:hypothetical protein